MSKKFKDFDWEYEKVFYDVLLPNWDIIIDCWPNAWFMNATWDVEWKWWPWECKIRKNEHDWLFPRSLYPQQEWDKD
jgi:hypothetical protein